MDTRMYIMTHKDFTKPEGDMYKVLQVGKEIGKELPYDGDNIGDNISEKNRNFCELTGIYWLWKNVSCDIIGICHYRRYFVWNEDFIQKKEIESLLSKYDVITPYSGSSKYENNWQHYEHTHIKKDMEVCRNILEKLAPDYLHAFDYVMSSNLECLGNMVITRKITFDEYCSWMFPILFELEKNIDISGYDEYQARIFGFISERLFRVWLINNKYKVFEMEVRMIDPKDSHNQIKAMELKLQCVQLILKNLLEKYKAGNAYDLVDNSAFDIDFHGKIPVWICWFQGIEQAPELVKCCYDSIKKYMPEDETEIHLITFENIGNYITMPDWVLNKFEQGKITLTHLSDIIRAGLLYRYGGIWVDSTYYMVRPFPNDLFQNNKFYTIRNNKIAWKADISKSRWSGNFIMIEKNSLFMRFLLNSFYEYWISQDKLIDYYLIDYIIAVGYENIMEIRNLIDNCEFSQPEALNFQKVLHKKYDKEVLKKLTENTNIFKLSYKCNWKKVNLVGDKTFYGFISE